MNGARKNCQNNDGQQEEVCNLENFLNYLSPMAKELLLCLAPFREFIFAAALFHYLEELQQQQPFKHLPFEKFDEVIGGAMDCGLLLVKEDNPSILTIQPAIATFLQNQLVSIDDKKSQALKLAFRNHYQGLSDYYYELLASGNQEKRDLGIFFCEQEYQNLCYALQVSLDIEDSIDIFFCLDEYLLLINDNDRLLFLCEYLCQRLASYPAFKRRGKIGLHIMMALGRLANCYLEINNLQKAKKYYYQVAAFLPTLPDIEPKDRDLGLGNTYHQLGMISQQLADFAEAKRNYEYALEVYTNYGDRYECASTYYQLGMLSQQIQKFNDAKIYYQKSLTILQEFGDRYSQGSIYYQLGLIAKEKKEYRRAKANLKLSLSIFIDCLDESAVSVVREALKGF
jgi:tetratricopeptide (TPR) repeat protein